MAELILQATTEALDRVIAFVNEELQKHHCQIKQQMQIDIAVEEIFVNIAHYAYNPGIGNATISVEVGGDPTQVIITFMDKGIPYDPLMKADPDTTLALEDRVIGGLGIYMVKNSMDELYYEYKEGKNILTLKKKLEDV